MADESHLAKLRAGVEKWNAWRKEYSDIRPDLREANLSNADLAYANLSNADLSNTNLSNTNLAYARFYGANLSNADLSRADLSRADLAYADLAYADLSNAHLSRADLFNSDLSRADLSRADLSNAHLFGANLSNANLASADLANATLARAILVETTITDAVFTGCDVYGISAWNLCGAAKDQTNLNISNLYIEEPAITVDDLEVAQFIYMLRKSKKLRDVLTTIRSRLVLILGRFGDRKYVLEAIAEVLRENSNYIPVIFDWEPPEGLDLIDTVKTLALLSKFVIVDLTEPESAPYEIDQIAQMMVPIQPLFQTPQKEPALLQALRKRHHWLLEPYYYNTIKKLSESLRGELIGVAETKATELKTQQK